ncbi:MAG: hypothetical protein RI964_3032 [Pseudomonadota bacterium]|jgi:hypothetical protein
MDSWLQRHVAARQFALGFALIGLMLTFVGAALLVFPYKATANQELQSELLYDLLGHLDYRGDDKFVAVDDSRMQRRLQHLLADNHLDGLSGSAYIRNRNNHSIVWRSAKSATPLDTDDVKNTYNMQFVYADHRQVAVQNFWISKSNHLREEYQMVVALPAN